jgi:penicillin amidase
VADTDENQRRHGGLRAVLRALRPPPLATADRLAQFPTTGLPLERDVIIRWNDFQVPHIEAATDRDLFVTLGLVHAHLRGAQLALFRLFWEGRLAEAFGPLARKLDHALRILDYGHAADEIGRRMPAETRAFLEAFLEGVNVYQQRMTELPPEYGLLGLEPAPYTMRDIVVGARLAGTDFTWVTFMALLPRRGREGFARLWNRTLEAGESPIPGTHPEGTPGTLEDLLMGAGRAGSNSIAVAAHRSASGGALIANDPHLGLSLPSLWLLAGVRSPSFHLVGFMIPGLPAFMLGRNPDLGWGGTNMRAASSDLFDVSRLPAGQIETTETTIRTRFGASSRHPIRRTPFGPIISDAKALKLPPEPPIALRWIGHEPTDEFSAFFRAARARTPEQFREAFVPYGISGQNMLFADRAGNIGKIMAVILPDRRAFPKDDPVLDAAADDDHWRARIGVMDLPWVVNPPSGVLASANDRPTGTDVAVGFTFGSDDRIRRLYALLAQHDKLSVANLEALHRDTNAPDAAVLASALAREIEAVPGFAANPKFMRRLSRWAGDYGADAFGAVAFEALLFHLVPPLYGGSKASQLPDLLGQWSYLTTFLLRDLGALAPAERHRLLRRAVGRATRDAARFRQWGDMHRLKIGHTIARLPLIGRAFVVADIAVGGSRQTPMKMAHGLVNRRHAASFGQMARHISDMADPDANWFVILGGNDGWPGSANYADQIALWCDGRYIRMPLRQETVIAEFPHEMRLAASASGSG